MSKSFTLNGHIVRTVMEDSGQALYVASDICAALGYSDRSYALSKHCKALPLYRQAPTVNGSQRCRVLDDNDVQRLINACRLRDIIAVKQELLDATHPWKKLRDDPEPVQQEIALPEPVAEVVAEPAAAELVPTFMAKIGGVEQLCVDARVLHGFLESKRAFSNWVRERIDKYEFVGGVDYEEVYNKFVVNPPNPSQGGRPTKEYTLTIDMAKELSMVENNEQGRKARRYFIEMERKALASVQTPTPQPQQPHQDPEPSPLQNQPNNTLHDLLAIHKVMQDVNGIDPVALMAKTLEAIEKATSLPVHLMAQALPTAAPVPAPPAGLRQDAHLTATDIGALLGVTADHIQGLLHQTGMLAKDGSGWKLTEAGKRHGEMRTIPARSPRGHYVLWKPTVLSVLHDPRATH